MVKEARDAVKDERPFAGVHILATALLCAKGSGPDELELARRILERDPRVDAPRETESVAGAFNRHMDAAIDSLNDSVGEPFRVGRRARLAQDLDRAGLVLIDRCQVADMIAVIHELRGRVAELEQGDGQDLGAELAGDECPHENQTTATTGDGVDVRSCLDCGEQLEIGAYPREELEPRDYPPATVVHD